MGACTSRRAARHRSVLEIQKNCQATAVPLPSCEPANSPAASRWKVYDAPPASAISFTHYLCVRSKGKGRMMGIEFEEQRGKQRSVLVVPGGATRLVAECMPTLPGSVTIMWQSMKMPGTAFETEAMMGAPASNRQWYE